MTKNCHLLSLTALIFLLNGWSFSAQAEDKRQPILLNAEEREVVLIEMRNFLRGSQQVLEASLNENMPLVHQTAEPLGMKMLKTLPEQMIKDMPKSFFAMFKTLHYGFAEIADIAKAPNADSKVVLKKLSEMQKLCVGCHATYQLKIKP